MEPNRKQERRLEDETAALATLQAIAGLAQVRQQRWGLMKVALTIAATALLVVLGYYLRAVNDAKAQAADAVKLAQQGSRDAENRVAAIQEQLNNAFKRLVIAESEISRARANAHPEGVVRKTISIAWDMSGNKGKPNVFVCPRDRPAWFDVYMDAGPMSFDSVDIEYGVGYRPDGIRPDVSISSSTPGVVRLQLVPGPRYTDGIEYNIDIVVRHTSAPLDNKIAVRVQWYPDTPGKPETSRPVDPINIMVECRGQSGAIGTTAFGIETYDQSFEKLIALPPRTPVTIVVSKAPTTGARVVITINVNDKPLYDGLVHIGKVDEGRKSALQVSFESKE